MTWILFYLCCFVAGLVLCALAAATGGHGAGHAVPHAHFHVHGTPGHHAGLSYLNAFTVTAFLCWFGGAGYLLQRQPGWLTWVVLVAAVLCGMVGAGVIHWFTARVLLPRERELTAEETSVAGVVGRVSGPLAENRVGEIHYTQLGARRSVPARSASGAPIGRDEEVIVLRYEQGIAYVQPWQEFEGERR